jgi:hypothetical protein
MAPTPAAGMFRWLASSRHKHLLLPLGIVVILVVMVAVVVWHARPIHALANLDDGGGAATAPEPVGARIYFAIAELQATGSHQVQLLSAQVTDPPVGIRAISVMGAHFDANGGYVAATDAGTTKGALPIPPLFPVSAVVLTPGHPTTWYLLAQVQVTRRGTFLIRGVTVKYRTDGHSGTHFYHDELKVQTL